MMRAAVGNGGEHRTATDGAQMQSMNAATAIPVVRVVRCEPAKMEASLVYNPFI
jgi:hypothetical protein